MSRKIPVPYLSPAERVIKKFGNAYRMSEATKLLGNPKLYRSPSVIFRWTYPKEKGGTGGNIPSSAIKAVKAAARIAGVLLLPEDFF